MDARIAKKMQKRQNENAGEVRYNFGNNAEVPPHSFPIFTIHTTSS